MARIYNELRNYQSIPRELVFDKTLSDRARFVYVFMACKPGDWDFFLEPMAREIGYSVDTLRKYINELVTSGWLIKGEQTNENGVFGAVEYTLKATKISDTENFRHGKNQTQINKDIKEINTDIIKEKEDINISPKKKLDVDEEFEKVWKLSGRKGSKQNALKRWKVLSDEDKEKAKRHIPHYYSSSERAYLKDFEGYLHGRYFDGVVMDRKGNVLYDPDKAIANRGDYSPYGKYIWFDEESQMYWTDDPLYFDYICDGYEDKDRPDGATLILNNARGKIVWSKKEMKWIIKK